MHTTRQGKARDTEPDSRGTQESGVSLAGAFQIVLLPLFASAWGHV